MNFNHPHSEAMQALESQVSCQLLKNNHSQAGLDSASTSYLISWGYVHDHSFPGEAHELILEDTVERQLRKL